MEGFVLKTGDLFLFTDPDDALAEGETGLYHRDTRYLSRLQWVINDQVPRALHTWVEGASSRTLLGYPTSRQDEISPFAVAVNRRRLVSDALYEELELINHHREPVRLKLALTASADFADMFLVRGYPFQNERPPVEQELSPAGFRFRYRGGDGVLRLTVATVEPEGRVEGERLTWEVELAPQASLTWRVRVAVDEETVEGGDSIEAPPSRTLAVRVAEERRRLEAEASAWRASTTSLEAPDEDLVLLWERGREDLRHLATDMGDGPVPTAGIPWFAVLFGRDSLLTAREAMLLTPSLARATLLTLGRYQGTKHDPYREEAPGKILHELRQGELARMGLLPHTPYYGTVDATPLFLILAGDVIRWTGDRELLSRLRPHVEAALGWVTGEGDLDGDGFLEYDGRGLLTNQGWKDSFDSTVDPDGRLAQPPIALVEVQGYLVAALRSAAFLARLWGDAPRARELDALAGARQQALAERFRMPGGFYALALDGEKRPVTTYTSNPGHLLWARAVTGDDAARLTQRLMEPDFFSGYGLRTLAAGQTAYDPLSYHNGSVWPHDTVLALRGMASYGQGEAAARLARGLLDASRFMPLRRLPELFAGYPAGPGGPVPYPVACSPQAWAAAVPFLLVEGLLNLEVDAIARELRLKPYLPPWLPWIRLKGLIVGEARVDLSIEGQGHQVTVEAHGLPDGWKLLG